MAYPALIEENGQLQSKIREQAAEMARQAERIRLLEIEVGTLKSKVKNLEWLSRVSG